MHLVSVALTHRKMFAFPPESTSASHCCSPDQLPCSEHHQWSVCVMLFNLPYELLNQLAARRTSGMTVFPDCN